MMAGMAGYIFKNKMRPRPEWQKNAVPVADPSNPFRILPMKTGDAAARQPHPMINKRFPHRADARAAARLQSHLHRLRAHPRIRIHHHASACRWKNA